MGLVRGVGFIGVGCHVSRTGKKQNPAYVAWNNMLRRCYSKEYILKNPTYTNCTVDALWHNFQNFADWFEEQRREDGWELDKDLRVPGSKVYSPETCSFIPAQVNVLIAEKPVRGLPRGVMRNKKGFAATVTYNRKKKHLGTYKTPEEAFNKYKTYKEQLVRLVAEKHVDDLHPEVYKSLLSYQVPEWDNQIN